MQPDEPETGAREETRLDRVARSKEEIDKALEIVTEWVLDKSQDLIEEEVERTVANVIRDHAMRLRIMLVGLSKRRVLNLMELAADLDHLETHFRTSMAGGNVSLPIAIKMYNSLMSREQLLMNAVAEVAESGYPTKIETSRMREVDRQRLEDLGAKNVTPAQRDKVRTLVGSIRDVLIEKGAVLQADGSLTEPGS